MPLWLRYISGILPATYPAQAMRAIMGRGRVTRSSVSIYNRYSSRGLSTNLTNIRQPLLMYIRDAYGPVLRLLFFLDVGTVYRSLHNIDYHEQCHDGAQTLF